MRRHSRRTVSTTAPTETVVTKVYNDMLMAADSSRVSALCLLDLSAAFDTVDHDLLMRRLERQYGLRSVVVEFIPLWQNFPSPSRGQYVTNCLHPMFRTTRLSARSASVYPVHCGPGRPRRGTWRQFPRVRRRHADVHYRRDEVTSAVLRLENCIEEVSDWMSADRLKLNADKTELLWAGSRHGPAMLGSAGPSLQLRTETVVASDPTGVS